MLKLRLHIVVLVLGMSLMFNASAKAKQDNPSSIAAVQGKIFEFLLNQINDLQAQIDKLSEGGTSSNRIVFSDKINLDEDGDTIRTYRYIDRMGNEITITNHFRRYSVPDLSVDDPPAINLYQNPPTQNYIFDDPWPVTFRPVEDQGLTRVYFENGAVLVRYKIQTFFPDGREEIGYGFGYFEPGTVDIRLVLTW